MTAEEQHDLNVRADECQELSTLMLLQGETISSLALSSILKEREQNYRFKVYAAIAQRNKDKEKQS